MLKISFSFTWQPNASQEKLEFLVFEQFQRNMNRIENSDPAILKSDGTRPEQHLQLTENALRFIVTSHIDHWENDDSS